MRTLLCALLLVSTAQAKTFFQNAPDGTLLCIQVTGKDARMGFLGNAKSVTLCRSFPTGSGVIIFEYRHKPPCFDAGLVDPNDFYTVNLTGKCGPVSVHSE